MATVRDILTRACRKIGVVAEDEQLSGDQAANALNALNDMMHGWALEGVDIGHADLAVDEDFPLESRFIEGTVYLLADRLAPDNRQAAPDADRFLRLLQAAYMVVEEAEMPAAFYRPRWRL